MEKLKELQERNYNAQIKRGKELNIHSCINQIEEEVSEFQVAYYWENEERQKAELTDIILSCLTTAKLMGWDTDEMLENGVIYNETRKN